MSEVLGPREASLAAALAAARPGARLPVEDELRLRLDAVPARDRGLSREILAGSVRRRGSLDAIIDHFSRRNPPALIVREILRQALYQVLFLDRVPDHAATHAAVDLAKANTNKKSAGYVNGILRAVLRARRLASPGHPRALVVSREHGVGIEGLPVPEISEDLPGNLSLRYSYPRALVARWLELHGRELTESLLVTCNQAPAQVLRVNLRATSREMVLAALDEAGLDAEPGRWPPTVIVPAGGGELTRLPGFAEGELSVQGEAAQRAALLASPEGARVVVDLCAAPGGKAAQLAELGDPEMTLYCVDSSADRLVRLRESFDRLHLPQPAIVVGDARSFQLPEGIRADRVLIDAPCSNTGVLSRRLEARWRFDPEALAQLASVGTSLLVHGLSLLAPGGRLVYSTCSLEPEENRNVIENVLAGRPELQLEGCEELLPTELHGDGGFVATIVCPR